MVGFLIQNIISLFVLSSFCRNYNKVLTYFDYFVLEIVKDLLPYNIKILPFYLCFCVYYNIHHLLKYFSLWRHHLFLCLVWIYPVIWIVFFVRVFSVAETKLAEAERHEYHDDYIALDSAHVLPKFLIIPQKLKKLKFWYLPEF